VTLPTWKTVKASTLFAIHRLVVDTQVESLRSVESACISFDGWDGGLALGQLIGITYSWVDSNFIFQSALLDLISVSSNHTGTIPPSLSH